MRRGRVLFLLGIVAVVAGAGGFVWYAYLRVSPPIVDFAAVEQMRRERAAADDRPPEPWAPSDPWWKQTTIDAFDRVNQGKHWPSARRAVVAFGADLGGDPPRTGDAPEDAREAAAMATSHGCDDPLVLFIRGRYLLRSNDDEDRPAIREGYESLARAAEAFRTATGYPAYLRCLAGFEAANAAGQHYHPPRARSSSARAVTGRLTGPTRAEKVKEFADAAAALFPEVGADAKLPLFAALQLGEMVGYYARLSGRDRMEVMAPLLAAMEKGGRPRSHVLTVRGDALTGYAWDARGGGWADTVTPEGWRGFAERLAQARKALTEAWELDKANTYAAARMIRVCMGQDSGRQEMETWFKRAIEADPGNYNACHRKMTFLEPKWGGSPQAMVEFGREMVQTAANDPRSARLATILVDIHWTLSGYVGGSGEPEPAYFAEFPEVWEDVGRAYEVYLKQAPQSRYHRTRYAVMAGWAGRWDVAAAQFEQLGDGYSREVVSENLVKALRDQATQKAKAGPSTRAT